MSAENLREIAEQNLSNKQGGLTLELVNELRQNLPDPSAPLHALYLGFFPVPEPWSDSVVRFRLAAGEYTNNGSLARVRNAIAYTGEPLALDYMSRHRPEPIIEDESTWGQQRYPRILVPKVEDLIRALSEIHPDTLRRDKRIQLNFLIALFL